jgi:probable rRNA maturation factor
MISFSIDSKYKKLKVEDALTQAADLVLLMKGKPQDFELTIVLTNDVAIQKLNRRFRAENRSTDVLSFPADETDLETKKRYLGDVVISVECAEMQAEQAGHNLVSELQLLTVHGVLHLLGYDHAAPDERNLMWAAQDRILSQLGLSIRSYQAESRVH